MMRTTSTLPLFALGALTGAASQLNWLARYFNPGDGKSVFFIRLLAGAVLGPVLFLAARALCRALVERAFTTDSERQAYRSREWMPFLAFLLTLLGAAGYTVGAGTVAVMLTLFVVGQLWLRARFRDGGRREQDVRSISALSALFFLSGFAALIYQVVWQRALFGAFGVNIESTTVVVAVFMLGLGLGSTLGGALSSRFKHSLPLMFLLAEIGIGAFGLFSLQLIEVVSAATVMSSLPVTAAVIFGLLVIPTMMMGATLPILVSHLMQYYKQVGSSVGVLYFANTLGSAFAAIATTEILFAMMGMRDAVRVAVLFNFAVGGLVFLYARTFKAAPPATGTGESSSPAEARAA